MTQTIEIPLMPEPAEGNKQAAEQQPTTAQQPKNATSELELLKAHVAELQRTLSEARSETAKIRDELSAATAKAAVHDAQRPQAKLNSGSYEAAREKLRGQMGNAQFHALPPKERSRLLGFPDITPAEVQEARRIFGPSSSSEAVQLAKYRPSHYARLRSAARENGII